MTCYLNGMVAARPVVLASRVRSLFLPGVLLGACLGVCLGALGCGGKREDVERAPASRQTVPPSAIRPGDRTSTPAVGENAASGEASGTGEQPAEPAEFPKETRSLELVRTASVRLEPSDDAKRIGTVAVDTRVGWTRTASGKGCQKSWALLRPRGWICADYVRPSTKPPLGRELPVLDRGEIVPGTYGKITAERAVTFTIERPEPKPDPKKGEKKRKKAEPAPKKGGGSSGSSGGGLITSPRQVDATIPDASGALPPSPSPSPSGSRLVEDKPIVGSVNVRQYDEVTLDGRRFWKIHPKEPEYVLSSAISPHRPSGYAGARLGDDTGWELPIAFVWSRWGGPAHPMTSAQGAGLYPTPIPARTPVPILETVSDAAGKPTAYRIGDARWLWAADVRVFQPVPPPQLLEPGERWIDIDLDSQILVAFEGQLPVYATMISSGSRETPTETGEYRMWLKEAEADMKGLNGEDPYSVATVPWTQFFSPEKGLALHTAYWHDQFGVRRSHGCVNLAPRDARWLYFWSDPQVPPGWTMAAGVVESPGSIVRVRTKEEPTPPPKGYAKKVVEARQQRAPVR
ncbi:MAG TPA: L,D-transpeptidase [Kofleriaceae bacterium]|nr:L,D-transpeptidase [Kofleriaceae bacterium]